MIEVDSFAEIGVEILTDLIGLFLEQGGAHLEDLLYLLLFDKLSGREERPHCEEHLLEDILNRVRDSLIRLNLPLHLTEVMTVAVAVEFVI